MAAEPSPPIDPAALARDLIEAAWGDRDADRIADRCAPDVVVNDPAALTETHGPEAYERYVQRRSARYGAIDLTVDDVTVAGGTVALRTSGRAVPDAEVGPDRDDDGDEPAEVTGFEVVQVADGTVVEWAGTVLEEAAVGAFEAGLRGDVVRPGDPDYDAVRAVWNGVIDRYPAMVVRCRGVADVADAVAFAREHDLLVAVRGGGHNVAGSAVCDGGLVIDCSPMDWVDVDLDAETARVGAGATWADVDRETQQFGLATPGGVVSTTGVAGLTLGGGMGWLRRKYGLTIDNLVSVDLVTADGEVLTASEHERPELFWGLRGGGGNFGVVTAFEYRLHPVGPEVAFAGAMYPLAAAREVLPAWREYMAEAPEEVSAEAVFWTLPEVPDFPAAVRGEPVVAIPAVHCGPPADGRETLRPLRELAEPLVDLSGVLPYVEVQRLFDPFMPDGELCYYWKSLDLDRFDADVIDALVGHARERPSPRTMLPVWHHGGAMNRVGPEATAYGPRETTYMLSIDATWEDPADTEENVAWTREVWADMHRFSDGGLYLNFPGFAEEGEALARSAHGETVYERLVALKAEYDPANRFRPNGDVTPSTPSDGPA